MPRFFVITMLSLLFAAPAMAQPKPPAMPVAKVTAEPLEDTSGPVVVELFTAKSCAFCTQADQLFAALSQQAGVIAIACHVDYFHAQDPLAHAFCTDRQNWYMDRMRDGPNYTPQLVVNGSRDAVGSRTDQVAALVADGRKQGIQAVTIRPAGGKDRYDIMLPDAYQGAALKGWTMIVTVFDNPAPPDSGSGGEAVPSVRAADQMQVLPLDGYKGPDFRLTVPLSPGQSGFTVFLQRQDTARIVAAGQFIKPGDGQSTQAVPPG